MAKTKLNVVVNSQGTLEQATCRIEQQTFPLTKTPSGSWIGSHTIDVVGLVQYQAFIVADSFTTWNLEITQDGKKEPFVSESSTVRQGTTVDGILGVAPLK